MKKLVMLVLLLLCALSPVSAATKDDFTVSLTLTVGERSRDSHAETVVIRLDGNSLTYEQTFSGRTGGREPVRKEFKLKSGELDRLKSLVKEKNLLGSGVLKFEPSSEQRTYFEMNVRITLKGVSARRNSQARAPPRTSETSASIKNRSPSCKSFTASSPCATRRLTTASLSVKLPRFSPNRPTASRWDSRPPP